MPSNTSPFDLDDLEPGDVPVAEPIDGVKLEFHGLAPDDAGPMLIQATVEPDDGALSIVTYEITGIADGDDGEAFIAEPERQRHTQAESAIREAGGTIKPDEHTRGP